MAGWRWRRLFGDPGPVYRAVLDEGARARSHQLVAALRGLDDDRDDGLPAAAAAFLAHPSPAVRCAAVRAVGRHASPAELVGELAPLLLDSSGRVARAALRYLRGYALPPAALARLDAAGTARARRAALSIRQHLSTWDRVHADLTAINGPDPDLAQAARTDLLSWLQHGAATSYGAPGTDRVAEIARLLATARLTDTQRREIAFVAGIRPTVTGPQRQ